MLGGKTEDCSKKGLIIARDSQKVFFCFIFQSRISHFSFRIRMWNYVVTANKPTAVSHSLVGNFTSPTDLNLIIRYSENQKILQNN